MVFQSILAALDPSPTGKQALDVAAELALALNARLTIIAVSPEVPSYAYRAQVDVGALEREAEEETDRLLRAAVESLPEELPATIVLKQGNAGERIVEQIDAGDHDLLVMGSRGRGRVASNLLGSVGAYVHYHSRVATLVIHPDEAEIDPNAPRD
jgi:nucleotide-binding universal stress UspA family protein